MSTFNGKNVEDDEHDESEEARGSDSDESEDNADKWLKNMFGEDTLKQLENMDESAGMEQISKLMGGMFGGLFDNQPEVLQAIEKQMQSMVQRHDTVQPTDEHDEPVDKESHSSPPGDLYHIIT